MTKWQLSLTSNGEDLRDVRVKRGIFHGDHHQFITTIICIEYDPDDDNTKGSKSRV